MAAIAVLSVSDLRFFPQNDHLDAFSVPVDIPVPATFHLNASITMSYRKNKRISLQSLLIPSFINHTPDIDTPTPSDTLATQDKSRTSHSPPPDFLLDDDPFANLSSPRAAQVARDSPPPAVVPVTPPKSPTHPRSPLAPPLNTRKSTPVLHSVHPHARPASQKPAFPTRPSLPSLYTLAQINVVLPKKVRKGKVGAQLPFEPWDDSPATPTPSTPSVSHMSPGSPNLDYMQTSEISPSQAFEPLSDIPLSQDVSETPDLMTVAEHAEYLDFATSLILTRTRSASESSSSSESYGDEITNRHSHDSVTTSPSSFLSSLEDCPFGPYDASSAESEEGDSLQSPPDEHLCLPALHDADELSLSDYAWAGFSEPSSAATPHSSMIFLDHGSSKPDEDLFEPGTSVGTIRQHRQTWDSNTLRRSVLQDMWKSHVDAEEPIDSGGWDDRRGHTSSSPTGFSSSGGNGYSRSNGYTHHYSGNGNGGYWNGGKDGDRDDDDDDRRNNRGRPSFSAFSSSSDPSTDDDEEEDSTDDYGPPSESTAQGTGVPPTGGNSSSDDDVPLAKSIPTALRAQRTIRIKAQEDKEKRRRDRAARMDARHGTLPPGAALARTEAVSSSQEAASHAAEPPNLNHRGRSLPPEASHQLATQPLDVSDLNRKLQDFQATEMDPYRRTRSRPSTSRPTSSGGRNGQPSQATTVIPPVSPHPSQQTRGLRSTRSLHRSSNTRPPVEPEIPLPTPPEMELTRSTTRSSRTRDAPSPRNRSASVPRAPPLPTMDPSAGLPRTSVDRDRSKLNKPRISDATRPPMPPLPANVETDAKKGIVSQQRIFIGDRQRFNMVEITPSTNAGDVINMIEAQGSLKGWVGSGGWMVWEVATDFGMERPIRSFELLSDVEASWNKDKMVNTFVVRLTPLAPVLSKSAMPTSSPVCSGYVEWEAKRGKWTKRWLQLREHSIYLAKRDNGKDEVLLCSLSNFDFYKVTRLTKAPKPFVFALKSTDNLSFFENAADYLHVFACNEETGAKWMERILLARSYVLYQERNVLFNPKSNNSASAGSSLARAPTRKSTSQRPPKPLVNVTPNDVFEPGSLLQRQQ